MQPYPLVIRIAGEDDIPLLCNLARQTFLDAFDKLNDPKDNQSFINEHFTPDKDQVITANTRYRFYAGLQQPASCQVMPNYQIMKFRIISNLRLL